MVIKTITGALLGIECKLVTVEVDTSSGLPTFDMVGSLSAEVREAKERVRIALGNNGFQIPPKRITINLSPADIRKEGTSYDLPIAVGLLASLNFIEDIYLEKMFLAGEMGLNGEIKAIRGVLPMVLEAKKNGLQFCILPKENLAETKIIDGIRIFGVSHLGEVIGIFYELNLMKDDCNNQHKCEMQQTQVTKDYNNQEFDEKNDFRNVRGQESVKRAMEIAAAGFHNLLMIGPPGSGKSMSAKCLPSILPSLTLEEKIEVSKIYSVAGLLSEEQGLIQWRPFIAPHHTVTQSAFSGGGRNPRPGLISRAHKGVLFLDETPQFSSYILEALRQPMEDKKIHVSRNGGDYIFPADFMLVAAMNPCPCGYYPDLNKCSCTPEQISRYLNRISGPILDRIDLCIEATKLDWATIQGEKEAIMTEKIRSSKEIRENVCKAREMQRLRYANTNIKFNSELSPAEIQKYIQFGNGVSVLLERIFHKYELSARSYHKLIKVARTIADLEESELVEERHVLEMLAYRNVEDKYWHNKF